MIINLKNEISSNLIVRLEAENLFKQLDEYSTNITRADITNILSASGSKNFPNVVT